MSGNPCPIGPDIDAIIGRLLDRLAQDDDERAAELGAKIKARRRRQEGGEADPQEEQAPAD